MGGGGGWGVLPLRQHVGAGWAVPCQECLGVAVSNKHYCLWLTCEQYEHSCICGELQTHNWDLQYSLLSGVHKLTPEFWRHLTVQSLLRVGNPITTDVQNLGYLWGFFLRVGPVSFPTHLSFPVFWYTNKENRIHGAVTLEMNRGIENRGKGYPSCNIFLFKERV
jgi:hypothetical protein